MTPRLLLGNFDFEHRLDDSANEPSSNLKRLNAELATAWLAIANEGDWLWTPTSITDEFFREMEQWGLPKVVPVTSFHIVPRDTLCVPWGWSNEVRRWARQFGWTVNAPSENVVRMANSRATSEKLEREWNVGLNGAQKLSSLPEVAQAIEQLRNPYQRWVIKAEFSMSARERILGCGLPSLRDENWIRNRLKSNQIVFFEPWVERIEEIGIQFEVPTHGEPELIGWTPMQVNERGQYAGSWFASESSSLDLLDQRWPGVSEVTRRAAQFLQSCGYFGPLGIDAMRYRMADGSEQIRPLQDINARWTMGRLSLGWRKLLRARETGFWQHSSMIDPQSPAGLQVDRMVLTNPDHLDGKPVYHRSRILIGKTGDD